MIKKILLSIVLLGAVSSIDAQTIDRRSNKILNEVTQNYNTEKSSYFEFVFGSGTNGTVTKKEKGSFLSQGDKYVLNVMGTKQIFDGKKIYNINEEDQEITIAKPDKNDAVFSPVSFLKSYRKDFNVKYVDATTLLNKKADLIKLEPINKSGLSYVYLFIDSKSKELLKLEQHGTNKDVAVIVLTKHVKNKPISRNNFKFNKKDYKNYIITEL